MTGHSGEPVTASSPRWQRVSALFEELVDIEPSRREAALRTHIDADPSIVDEVRSLLTAHDAADDRFDQPAWAQLSSDFVEGLAPRDSLTAAHRVGPYEIVRKIGEGGMGAVYEAVRADDTYRQRVAIKTISRGADSASIVARFRRERQILAALQHPNIALLLDGGVTAPTTLQPAVPYFVMEYVDGLPIHQWCRTQRLTVPQRLDLMQQVCAAVQHAHRRLVVHRDLKPQNVFVSTDGVVKLLDFGIAKLTEASPDSDPGVSALTADGLTPMTTAYASPEQLRGEAVSTESDVYALGVLLYELLAGTLPFPTKGRSVSALREAVLTQDAPPPSLACTADVARDAGFQERAQLARMLAGDLDAIVLMAMRKEPERRYSSAEAMANDIVRHLKGHTISAQPDTVGYRVRRFVGRHRAAVILGASLVGVALASGAAILRTSIRAREESERTARISSFLQDVLGAADATAVGGTVPRLGPRVSVGMLLDSALKRVPTQFASDPAIRARLYLTFGSGLVAQSRMKAASAILDSSIALARTTYGETAEIFALASLEAAAAAMHRNRMDDARAFVAQARRAAEAQGDPDSELFGRVRRELTSIALLEGDYDAMEQHARDALAAESRRTSAPTLTKAVALNRLGSAASLKGRIPAADSLFRQSIQQMIALGSASTLERLDVEFNYAYLALDLGRVAEADSIAQVSLQAAQSTYGADSREAALQLILRAGVAVARNDLSAADADSRAAMRIIDSIPEVVTTVKAAAQRSVANVAMRQQNWRRADSALRAALADPQQPKRGLTAIYSLLGHSMVLMRLGQGEEADRQLQRTFEVYRASGVTLPATLTTMHMTQAGIAYLRGDSAAIRAALAAVPPAEADYMRKLFPTLPTRR